MEVRGCTTDCSAGGHLCWQDIMDAVAFQKQKLLSMVCCRLVCASMWAVSLPGRCYDTSPRMVQYTVQYTVYGAVVHHSPDNLDHGVHCIAQRMQR
jgi:hypothetical protein